MSDIDWSKPVECRYYEDDDQMYHPVVHVENNPDGSKFCVVRRPNGHHIGVRITKTDDRIRNVRRKVKHSRMYWIKRHNDGHISFTLSNDTSYCWRKEGHDVSEYVEEWEADADE